MARSLSHRHGGGFDSYAGNGVRGLIAGASGSTRYNHRPTPFVLRQHARGASSSVEAFAISAIVVALGEIGDKTQLLALMLAVRFRRPWPIIAGILVATLLNHTIAGAIGNWIRSAIAPEALKWVLAASFLGVAGWSLRADSHDDEAPVATHLGVFAVTAVAFFFAEMGDKTQIATLMLAARFESLPAVVAGTTLGMLVADVPVIFAGKLAADRIPFKAMRIAAASLFAALGIWVLIAGVPTS